MLNWLKRKLQSYSDQEREETWSLEVPFGNERLERQLFVAIHPARAKRIVVMIPGCNGTLDGYEKKYAKLAAYLVSSGLGAVVRTGNPMLPGLPYETTCQTNLRGVVDGALERSGEICGDAAPELLLVGWSAGASAIAAQAAKIPQVTGILLYAPSGDAGEADLRTGLEAFEGELFVVAGADDQVVHDLPQHLFGLATRARRKELVTIPDCDHQFRGALNGRIMSQAPLWAFAGREPFPDPQGGIHLYD
jgi:pimeloyl-ACP methyl ester carboxylesterase